MTTKKFDVFLCHNSQDKPAVVKIAEQLRHQGLRPWLDIWELKPGAIWQFVLEEQIENIGAAAIFAGQNGLGPWQSEEVYAFLQEFISRKCPVIPVMLPETHTQPRLPIFLRNRHWVDFRLKKPDPLRQLIWGITGERLEDTTKRNVVKPSESVPVVRPKGASKTLKLSPTALSRENHKRVSAGLDSLEHYARARELISEGRKNKSESNYLYPVVSKPVFQQASTADRLLSEKGINYKCLRDLLRKQHWKAADDETYKRMLEIVGKGKSRYDLALTPMDVSRIPCNDLVTINQLWRVYSQDTFGFTNQKEIFLSVNGNMDAKLPNAKVRQSFGDRVRWRTGGKWAQYSDIDFRTSAPKGHLPIYLPLDERHTRRRSNCRDSTGTLGWGSFSALMHRLKNCSL